MSRVTNACPTASSTKPSNWTRMTQKSSEWLKRVLTSFNVCGWCALEGNSTLQILPRDFRSKRHMVRHSNIWPEQWKFSNHSGIEVMRGTFRRWSKSPPLHISRCECCAHAKSIWIWKCNSDRVVALISTCKIFDYFVWSFSVCAGQNLELRPELNLKDKVMHQRSKYWGPGKDEDQDRDWVLRRAVFELDCFALHCIRKIQLVTLSWNNNVKPTLKIWY